MRRLGAVGAALLAVCLLPTASAQPTRPDSSAFGDWAAVVVAGDSESAPNLPTETFDNARRDVARALLGAGFRAENLTELSASPDGEPSVDEASPVRLMLALDRAAARARGGCLVYLTSHGSPQGVVMGKNKGLAPSTLKEALDLSCGDRPTVAVVSACYSGVFVPALAAPNRLVLTAARPDRNSFGCGVDDRYPYFDACVLAELPRAPDFLALSRQVRTCVDAREREKGARPPSEPQVSVGARIAPMLPLLSLRTGR